MESIVRDSETSSDEEFYDAEGIEVFNIFFKQPLLVIEIVKILIEKTELFSIEE